MGANETPRAARPFARLAAVVAGDRLWVALSSVIFLLVAVPLLALARHNQPTADDFCLVNRVATEGVIAFNRSIYLGWTGRFFTTLLYALFYASAAASTEAWSLVFKLAALATFAALVAAIWVCARAWAASTWRLPAQAWGVTAGVAALCLLGMPSLYEGVYWAASSLQYALSIVWMLGLVAAGAALMPGDPAPPRGRVGPGVFAMMLAAAAIGSNETVAALVFGFIALMLHASWRERASRNWWLAVLASALVAMVVLLAAPGNYARLGHVETLSVPEALARTAIILATHLVLWLTPALGVGVALIMLLSLREEAKVVRAWPHPCVVAMGMLAVLGGMLLPSVWAYHGGVPPRVLSTVYLAFAVFAGVLGLQLTSYLRTRYPRLFERLVRGSENPDLRIVICALALFSLPSVPNFRTAWRDLMLGHARAFGDASEQRYALAARAPRGSAVSFAPIAELPTTLAQEDLSPDAAHWKNVCFAARFGLLSVHTEPPVATGAR